MKYGVFMLIWFAACFSTVPSAGKDEGSATLEELVLNKRIAVLRLTQSTFLDALENLSSDPVPFAFGFEEVLRDRFADPEVREPRFDLLVENKTIREVLDALCAADSRYMWSSDGLTINVYPRATVDDADYLLNRWLPNLEINGITNVDQGLLAIVHQLPPPEEQVAHVQMGGDSSYPAEPWHASFQGLTVRRAMNRLVAHMGPRACWILHGSRDFRAFGFFRTGFPQRGTN